MLVLGMKFLSELLQVELKVGDFLILKLKDVLIVLTTLALIMKFLLSSLILRDY